MKILEVYLECGGYDYQLIKGGISVYTWNLSKAMMDRGEQVSILTAMHGQQQYLTEQHNLVELDYCRRWQMEIDADPEIWGNKEKIKIPLTTKAYRLDKEGISIFILSNEILDLYPDTYYPPYSSKGKELGFFKPLVFQAEVIHFIRHWFAGEALTIHAHEPYYQYLIPAAFHRDSDKQVISTVQSNMPVNKKVYLPEVKGLFQQLDIQPTLDGLADELAASEFTQCLLDYLPVTHLNYPYPDNYVNLFALCLLYSDLVDFLSEGHLEFYSRFSGTAFRALYRQLRISELVQEHGDKFFVGGCALSDSWLTADFGQFDRDSLLGSLGLDPALPTFFHNARYAPNHKGQVEMILAIAAFLNAGLPGNFILRCVSGTGIADERFHQLAAAFPDKVVLKWQMTEEAELMAMAAAADFALFPSKFEMDTFLIAVGEAMLAGCVPIASEQLGMKHWHHSEKFSGLGQSTGFAVHRSFKEEDPQLVDSLSFALRQALELYQQPDLYREKSAYARSHALKFSWENAAKAHLEAINALPGLHTNKLTETEAGSRNSWHSQALASGHLLDWRRSNRAGDISTGPVLTVSGDRVEYRLAEAASVAVFSKQQGKYQACELVRKETEAGIQGEFVGELSGDFSSEISSLFLLVTLSNGDQFWDGFEAGEQE
ncbi:hypothetical protein [Thalassomonas haliotis]|uniref:Glycosyl transferase family 1 n=1 Tax=Thalassomonas haliotis TaxID=485448 RepID=A0ABY7VBU8_9GAMM|nr:hypothetical protein [Thalassomonas haliotis]WDE11120.1 glycosyl transferase family 1 [Thalassomonas haliotis]